MAASAVKLLRTLRHHRADQLLYYLRYRARRTLPPPSSGPAPPGLQPKLHPREPFLGHVPWHEGQDIPRGRFRFLNRKADLGFPPDWEAAPEDLLWRFHLHGFDWLAALRSGERVRACRSWLESYAEPDRDAWHPYPLSRRVTSWCKAGVSEDDLLASLYRQAEYLTGRLEYHLRGNHLLENARALVFVGVHLTGQEAADRWHRQGLELLVEQLDEQVLPDGGHFERSPMYHALMLELVLDVLNVLPEGDPEREELGETAGRMVDALASVTHPDGTLARLSDTTDEVPPPTDALLSYGRALTGHEPSPRERLPDTGYYRFEQGGWFLIVDGGPIGPRYLPAHGHADIFSFELDWNGVPWIVDSGVFEYESGDMRDYVRSTRAHSTVTVDGRDQAECWDSFRVARRYPPSSVSFSTSRDGCHFTGTFDGYAELIGDGIRHRRRLELRAGLNELVVEDTLTGRGEHRSVSRIHLHPDVEVRTEGASIHLCRGERTALAQIDEGEIFLEEGWFCPEFGKRERKPVLRLEARGPLPHTLSYQIRFGLSE